MAAPDTSTCVSCGSSLSGPYCASCGEKVVDPEAQTVRHFLREAVHELTDVDGRLYRTLGHLLVRPGRLTFAYLEGRRKRFLKPLTLFFFLNVLFFLAQGLVNINTYNSTLSVMLRSGPDGGRMRSFLEQHLKERRMSLDEFAPRYDQRSDELARTLVIIQVPMLAMVLLALFPRRMLYDHLVFATHYYAFTLMVNVLITAGIYLWLKLMGGSFNLEWPFVGLLMLYAALSIRGAYTTGWTRAVLTAVPLVVGYIIVLWIYRYILFGLVIWQV